MSRRRTYIGFTLVEILVAISVIAILATMVGVNLNASRPRARDARRLVDVHNIEKALTSYTETNGSWPTPYGDNNNPPFFAHQDGNSWNGLDHCKYNPPNFDGFWDFDRSNNDKDNDGARFIEFFEAEGFCNGTSGSVRGKACTPIGSACAGSPGGTCVANPNRYFPKGTPVDPINNCPGYCSGSIQKPCANTADCAGNGTCQPSECNTITNASMYCDKYSGAHTYIFTVLSAGQYGCDPALGRIAVLGVGDFETVPNKVCSLNSSKSCSTDADCTGVGTCQPNKHCSNNSTSNKGLFCTTDANCGNPGWCQGAQAPQSPRFGCYNGDGSDTYVITEDANSHNIKWNKWNDNLEYFSGIFEHPKAQ